LAPETDRVERQRDRVERHEISEVQAPSLSRWTRASGPIKQSPCCSGSTTR
jgi:hypothetical protein